MGLFKRAGKVFEETKRTFVDGKEAAYVCRSCEGAVVEDYEFCPHCGKGPVEAVE